MLQNDSIEQMSTYQEQQSLLSEKKQQIDRPPHPQLQERQPPSNNDAVLNQSQQVQNNEHQEQNSNAQLDNHMSIQINLAQNMNGRYSKIKVFIDFLILLVYFYELFTQKTIPYFALFFIILYLFNFARYRCTKQIDRSAIAVLYFWPIFIFIRQGYVGLNRDQKIYTLFYLLQIIPQLLKLFIGCFVVSCTCFCATCCFCFCAFSELKQYVSKYIDHYRFKKVKEDLCNINLSDVEDRQCPICLETGSQMNTQKCHHSFHPQCLLAWLDQHKTCPVCRAALY